MGAGASRAFEVPTMSEFIDIFDKEMRESNLYNEIKNSFDRDSFDLEVLMTILEDFSKDSPELFRTISPQTSTYLLNRLMRDAETNAHASNLRKRLEHLTERQQEASESFRKLKGIIRRECFNAVQKNVNMILKTYDELFSLLRQGEISKDKVARFHRSGDGVLNYPTNLKIFTTNYDTCMETFLNRHQVIFTQGVVPRYGYNVFDIDSFNDSGGRVGVFKLHGSVDLFRKNGEIRQLPVAYPSEEGMTYLGEEFGQELMRYPIEFGGYRHVIESPYLDLFRLFRDRIKNDPLWLLIGSSFRDLTICSIMNDVLRTKERGGYPMILLVNPSAEEVVKRLRNWGMTTFARITQKVEEKFGTPECIAELDTVLSPERAQKKVAQR